MAVKTIVVDGWCSGNPGPGGYRGLDLDTKEVLFESKCELTSNNVTEFLAICHAVGYCKIHKDYNIIYSDSEIAMKWIEKKKCKTYTTCDEETTKKIQKCERWLIEQKRLPNILKWDTKNRGEIPADTGRKTIKNH